MASKRACCAERLPRDAQKEGRGREHNNILEIDVVEDTELDDVEPALDMTHGCKNGEATKCVRDPVFKSSQRKSDSMCF